MVNMVLGATGVWSLPILRNVLMICFHHNTLPSHIIWKVKLRCWGGLLCGIMCHITLVVALCVRALARGIVCARTHLWHCLRSLVASCPLISYEKFNLDAGVDCCVVSCATSIGGGIVCTRACSWHCVHTCSLVALCAHAAVTAQRCCCINCTSWLCVCYDIRLINLKGDIDFLAGVDKQKSRSFFFG